MSEYRCPRCKRQDGLYEMVEVPGWRAVDAKLEPAGPGHGMHQDVEWYAATPTGEFGCCECEWKGMRRDLERLGLDGEPLPVIHPRQMRMDAA